MRKSPMQKYFDIIEEAQTLMVESMNEDNPEAKANRAAEARAKLEEAKAYRASFND